MKRRPSSTVQPAGGGSRRTRPGAWMFRKRAGCRLRSGPVRAPGVAATHVPAAQRTSRRRGRSRARPRARRTRRSGRRGRGCRARRTPARLEQEDGELGERGEHRDRDAARRSSSSPSPGCPRSPRTQDARRRPAGRTSRTPRARGSARPAVGGRRLHPDPTGRVTLRTRPPGRKPWTRSGGASAQAPARAALPRRAIEP